MGDLKLLCGSPLADGAASTARWRGASNGARLRVRMRRQLTRDRATAVCCRRRPAASTARRYETADDAGLRDCGGFWGRARLLYCCPCVPCRAQRYVYLLPTHTQPAPALPSARRPLRDLRPALPGLRVPHRAAGCQGLGSLQPAVGADSANALVRRGGHPSSSVLLHFYFSSTRDIHTRWASVVAVYD